MTDVDLLFDYLIFTDDHSRVVLSSSTSNYINANYIEVSLRVTLYYFYLINTKNVLILLPFECLEHGYLIRPICVL